MKNILTYRVAFGCFIALFCYSLSAQQAKTYSPNVHSTNKRVQNYQDLKNLGYTDKEVYEDLGNANFLTKNYETASFWYGKLKEINENGTLSTSYDQRYQYAQMKTSTAEVSNVADDRDWLAIIRADYQVESKPIKHAQVSYSNQDYKYKIDQLLEDQGLLAERNLEALNIEEYDTQNAYKAPIALTADGNTAYFSKIIYVKPLYGVFSKKVAVHKIYKADKINGQWKNIKEVALCPKYYSSLHPTVSNDGKRLFFASNMPGTFGKYDLYTATIHNDGSFGIAKNLGEKVNTKKDDLYPNIVGANTLFFASEGRKGYGGLDVFMVQIDRKKVGVAVNLGNPINSKEDDFSIHFMTENGMGYVLSNRGKEKGTVQKVTFSYFNKKKNTLEERKEYNLLEAFNNDSKIDYSTIVFKDE